MAYVARALGALLHRAPSLSSSASALRSTSLLYRNGFTGYSSLFQRYAAGRRIWTFQPLCMGRRSCKIAGRKDSQNLKKMKRNSKIGKEIVAAIKKGGPSPSSNTALAAILEKARELDVPKEIIERNIKRASEKGQDTYIEKVYEVYGFGGVGMVVEVLTDKITRSIADIRNVVKDCGAKLADPGSITFKFRQARVANIKVTDADKDQLLSIALDAGADDVIEPTFDDDDSEEDAERYYKIVTTSENYPVVLSKLREEGVTFDTDNGFELLPLSPIECSQWPLIVDDINTSLVQGTFILDYHMLWNMM